MTSIFSNFNVRFRSFGCNNFPSVFHHVEILAELENGVPIARAMVLFVDRLRVFDNFLHLLALEAKVQDDDIIRQFSSDLFDKFGRLQPQIVDNEYHKGSGCWGREMDDRQIKLVFVHPFQFVSVVRVIPVFLTQVASLTAIYCI